MNGKDAYRYDNVSNPSHYIIVERILCFRLVLPMDDEEIDCFDNEMLLPASLPSRTIETILTPALQAMST